MAVDRFPTIRAFANGGADMENYEHNLDADSILAYVGHAMQARLDPPRPAPPHYAPSRPASTRPAPPRHAPVRRTTPHHAPPRPTTPHPPAPP